MVRGNHGYQGLSERQAAEAREDTLLENIMSGS
jgi:hypothetical protein